MFFRRQSNDAEQWVAVSHEGGVVTAAAVSHADPQRSRVDWVWQVPAGSLADGLRALTRAPKWRGQALLGLASRAQYKLVATEAPEVPREEWSDALRWTMRDQVDFPVDDALIDVLEVPEDTAVRQTHLVMAAVLSRQAYGEIELACDNVGQQWTALDIAEVALRNISALAEQDDQAHALMAFGQDHAVLVITYKGELVMARQIDVPVASLVGAAASREAALNRVSLEVVRTLDTFERLHSQLSLSGLSVLPPNHLGDEIVALLSEQVFIPVKACNLADWIDLDALGEEADRLARHATLNEVAVIGAAMRTHAKLAEHQHLQLLDKNSVLTRDPAWSARLGLKLGTAVLAACVVGGVALTVMQARTQARAQAVEGELVEMQKNVGVVAEPRVLQELKELQIRQAAKQEMVEALQANMVGSSLGYSGFLLALARQSQPTLWITGVTITGDSQDLEIKGRMLTPNALPAYLQSLQRESLFAGRRFAQLEVKALDATDERNDSLSEFTLRTRATSEAPSAQAEQGKKL